MAPKNRDTAANETTPLLATAETGATAQLNEEVIQTHANGHTFPAKHNGDPQTASEEEESSDPEDDTPLPRLQIFLLCYCALTEPIAYFSIFPFVNQMIKETGDIAEENVGFWSGMIESLFSATQMLLMIFYGRAADRLGRKPVLVFSLAGVTLASALFGFSKTVGQMIAFRCLAGVFGGSVVTVRAMITENCTAKTQARAFSFYAFTKNLGIFIGPLIGGALAKPAEQYPRVFGGIKLLQDYPYALPTVTSGVVAASATIFTMLFVRETLHRTGPGGNGKNEPKSTWEIVKSPGVAMVLYLFGHTMLLGLALTAVSPVFFFTSPERGGYGFSPQMISIYLAGAGASQALWILLAFPPLQHKYSTGAVLRGCATLWTFMFAVFPIGNEFLRRGMTVPFWICVPINMFVGSGVSMAFTCVQLCLNDIAPSPATLGTLNALALTLHSGTRAVAPALFSAIFATGVRGGWVDGHLVWFVLVPLAGILAFTSRWLPEKAEGRLKKDNDET